MKRAQKSRTPVATALAELERRIQPLWVETVPLREAALRVAGVDVTARVDVPHFRRAAMDGFALASAATIRASAEAPVDLVIVGDAYPGRPMAHPLHEGQAARITTGAPVPEGADAVLMLERAEFILKGGERLVRVRETIAPQKHVAAIGEDIARGAVVVARGRRLRPQDVGVLASVGASEVLVLRRPTVRILVTGNELLPPGSMPSGARIVDSNSLVLAALVARDAAVLVGVEYVDDDRQAVKAALIAAKEDVVLVSGGSSVGPEDHVPGVLAEVGELTVHGVALRPASPAGFGFLLPRAIGTPARAVFLLPGNPVSCLAAYEFFAGPALRALGGLPRAWPHARREGRLARPIASAAGRVDYVRVVFEGDDVIPIAVTGASILSTTTRADGVFLVAAERDSMTIGERVTVLLY